MSAEPKINDVEAPATDAPARRFTEPSLFDVLRREPYRFEFFQAVRVLARAQPERKPVGYDYPPEQEVARFRPHESLKFPASQIHSMAPPAAEGEPDTLDVTFFGLTGPVGALPQHYTEILIERLGRKDRTLRDFLSLFDHRLISLFYRAWEKYRYWLAAERTMSREHEAEAAGPEALRSFVVDERPRLDLFSQILLDLAGLGTPALRYALRNRRDLQPRTAIEDQTFRFYAGLLAQRHRPAVALESMLQDFFGWPVRLKPFCGQWLVLDVEDQTKLVRGGNIELGRTAVAGRKVWDVQSRFRLQVGPLTYDQFCRMLPIGDAWTRFTQLARLYAGQQFDFDVQLLLLKSEVPPCRLEKPKGIGPRLGWNSWIYSKHFDKDVATVTLLARDV